MSQEPAAELTEEIRARLLARPELILSDRDLMRALIGAREAEVGENVIDIRGRAMQALESRLDRLEAAHESVISAAYDNQSGMNTIHRAVLSLLEPMDFEEFLENLDIAVAPILRVETLRLVMESGGAIPEPEDGGPLVIAPAGTVAGLISGGRRMPRGDDIVLRRAVPETLPFHGEARAPIRSEALLPIDLGPGRFPALLLMGSADIGRFNPAQGTDLLRFFGQAFRLVLISWLRK
ncbi:MULTISPECIES: DUF484 family protein [Paracoccus]|jgi:uncharacterized protein YigA (DUF484 family)|uniref:DUF484 family protein n=1 Tax=Paracoccus denitrificans (strain Pd 1222) TaxID=318586 RepID=A1B4Z3_PARDP|nr:MULTISPECIES: DUF484 family protein [Paracoccus]ABL70587.1 conserved hypothetical protein [Paracoccus denitrificans PD1222]MBB4627471.1 hypothetical protein [Paracoccus denitrificans]MCU7429439.1 DUF484 family protein [Paracoccus denitrificans]MDK8873683.1 DUF484 family protein [Paracoccus sp. SSJ]QAR25920.1 DUF484 family protein [Paracoccus denitrificans]